MHKYLFTLLLFILPLLVSAQLDSSSVQSPEAITNKMLELISGDIDEIRDWNTYRNLFLPTAQIISINPNVNPRNQVRVMNLEEFVRYVGPLYKRDGFEEYTIGLTINEFNSIANVFQSFYCRNLTGTYENAVSTAIR